MSQNGPNVLNPHLQMHPWPLRAGHLYREPLAASQAKSEICCLGTVEYRSFDNYVTQSPLEHLCPTLIPGSIAVRVASWKVTTKVVTE